MTDRADVPMLIWLESFGRRTADLSATEMGVYARLLCAMWLDPQGSLPNEIGRLARIINSDHRNFARWYMPRIVERFFTLGPDNRWRQDWVTKQIEQIDLFSKRQKKIAKIGWEKRKNGGFYERDLFGRTPAAPVDNPVETCGKPTPSHYPDHKGQKLNKINGAMHASSDAMAMPILSYSESSLPLTSVDTTRASGNAAQQKQELKKGFLQEAPAAPYRATRPPRPASNAVAKRDTPPAGNPRTRWEAELAANLGPDDFAQAIPLLEADKALCARATAAERRQPGSGAHVAATGLLKLTRARP
jgi:uncharacterized protein YdaU (DUF1376 family)